MVRAYTPRARKYYDGVAVVCIMHVQSDIADIMAMTSQLCLRVQYIYLFIINTYMCVCAPLFLYYVAEIIVTLIIIYYIVGIRIRSNRCKQ